MVSIWFLAWFKHFHRPTLGKDSRFHFDTYMICQLGWNHVDDLSVGLRSPIDNLFWYLGFQTPGEEVWLDPKNIPIKHRTSGGMTGRLVTRCPRKLVNVCYNLLINGIYWGYNPLILTFDPNFLGHPSRGIYWVYPPPSNSGKWRFIGIPY